MAKSTLVWESDKVFVNVSQKEKQNKTWLYLHQINTNLEKQPHGIKQTQRFICSFDIRNIKRITGHIILIVSNMLIHTVKTE